MKEVQRRALSACFDYLAKCEMVKIEWDRAAVELPGPAGKRGFAPGPEVYISIRASVPQGLEKLRAAMSEAVRESYRSG